MIRTPLALALLALPLPALAADVQIDTPKAQLSGSVWGEGDQCAVLIHGDEGSRAEWTNFAKKLATNGMRAITVDLRGHGDTGGKLAEVDYPSLVGDVDAVAAWATGQGCAKVHALGAGLGANLVLNAAATQDSPISDIVLLSPRPNIKGVKVVKAAEAYGGSVLVVTESDHVMGIKTANAIEDRAKGLKEVREVVTETTGLAMLNRDVELEGLVLSWVVGTYHLADGSGQAARRQLQTTTGDMSAIETTGTGFGESNDKDQ